MAQIRAKLWAQSLNSGETIVDGRGERTLGPRGWRYQIVLAEIDPESAPEFQASVASFETGPTSILRTDVAATIIHDVAAVISSSVKYKETSRVIYLLSHQDYG